MSKPHHLLLILAILTSAVPAIAESAENLEPRLSLTAPPLTMAKAWVVGDAKTGEVLWQKNGNSVRQIASTTKIMTCWIVCELARENPKVLEEIVTFSQRADSTGGSTSGLRAGEKIPVRDLLYGLMLPSGNDAAIALGEHFGERFEPPQGYPNADSLIRFIAEMNRRAKELGMRNTKYFAPHGDSVNRSGRKLSAQEAQRLAPYDKGLTSSTAQDLLKMAWTAMKNPLFRGYVSTRHHQCVVQQPNGRKRTATWNNTNKLLQIEGYDGVKTGTNRRSGECLVASGHYGDDHLYVIILGSPRGTGSRYVDSRNLFRWAWIQRGHLEKSRKRGK